VYISGIWEGKNPWADRPLNLFGGICKDDRQSQWGMATFDPQPTLNP